jgi:hypothetical protein
MRAYFAASARADNFVVLADFDPWRRGAGRVRVGTTLAPDSPGVD